MTSINSSYGIFDFYPVNQMGHYESIKSNLLKTSVLIARDVSPQDIIVFDGYSKISYVDNQEFIDEIHGRILTFAKVLSQIDLFKREFYMIMSIQNIFDYICKDSVLLSQHIDYLLETFQCFFEIFNFKIDNFCEINCDEHLKKEYKKLSRNFLKHQRYFYKEIYVSVGDETFIKDMTKLLVR